MDSFGLFEGHLNFSLYFSISALDLVNLFRMKGLFLFQFSLFGLFGLLYLRLEVIYRSIELTALLLEFGYLEVLLNKQNEVPLFVSSYLNRWLAAWRDLYCFRKGFYRPWFHCDTRLWLWPWEVLSVGNRLLFVW